MKVLCFGSANLDHVYKVDHFTVPGETQGCLEYNIKCGGKGVNQAIAMALAGNDTYFAGIIGSDGGLLKDALVDKGVHIDYMKISNKPTGHAIIEVDQSGQNHILLYGGTNKEIDFEYIDEVLSHFSKGDIVVLQNEINNVPYIIERCYEKEMKIFFNAAPYDIAVKNYPIEKVTWLVVNETEGAALSNEEDYEKIIQTLKQKYPHTHILFTMGKEGSRVLTDKEDIKVEALKVNAVDTTGAGDTYIGYFVRGIVEEMPLLETAQMATKASAIAVTRFGAVDSIPNYEEVFE
ncbi:ribokinase [Faecalibacillus intestinalis]|jgi:ribokinase|uniref:ribokinase n=1 Tax=Faecalibacillus intestinalis TaxID=1982626 RepID=UPI0022E41016|nr:ribokinase [Faecalibacillus intestinalis]